MTQILNPGKLFSGVLCYRGEGYEKWENDSNTYVCNCMLYDCGVWERGKDTGK